MTVLDFLEGEEPAPSCVRNLFHEAHNREVELYLSIINLGEVVYRVGHVRDEAEAEEILARMRRLPITMVPAGDDAVWAAVRYKMPYASPSISGTVGALA